MLNFLSSDVCDYRLGGVSRIMDRLGLDGMALMSAEFFEFATCFKVDVEPWERPVLWVVTRDGKSAAVLNEMSVHHVAYLTARQRVWLSDVVYYSELRHHGSLPTLETLSDLVVDVLQKLGLAGARIGVDVEPGIMSAPAARLQGTSLVPCRAELRELRWVKHPEEIEVMRAACALTDWGQDRYRENIRPGRLVQELDAQMASLMLEEGARRFPEAEFELPECFTLTGPASASPHGNSARCGARIEAADVLVNIIVPRLNGLIVENERTWFAGSPSPEQRRYYKAAQAANRAGRDAAVAGAPVSGIDEASQLEFERAGLAAYSLHRTGHGMGIICHEYPHDMAYNDRPLLPNEVYSIEPGIYLPTIGGFRLDDTVVVGETPEVLTKSPHDIEAYIVGE